MLPDPESHLQRLTIEDFLKSISENRKQNLYKAILFPLMPFMERIKATWIAPDGMPNILIVKNAAIGETELRDLIQTVCLAEGLLARSLEAQDLALKSLGTSKIPKTLGYFSVAKSYIMWSCAHEVFHYLRRHALVEKHFGSTPETKHALEYDADLCAAAAFYRYLQHFSAKKSSIHLKKATLQLLYCSLRINIDREVHMNFSGSNTHPHTAARILDIAGKLAMLNDFGIADTNFEAESTRNDYEKLASLIANLELAYIKSLDKSKEFQSSELFSFAQKNVELEYTLDRHKRWDEIQPLIDQFSIFSRRQIDNEASIAFIGENFSLPR
ncbi:hypothetical protein LPN04_02780 [Rugamonas sp. A1-17]|nr:hypothetical protein [Rugamonas sp. A1-17]